MEPGMNSALRRALLKYPPLTNYFQWIGDSDPCRLVILGRESARQQDRDGNLAWQRTHYRRLTREMGFHVLRTFGEIGSGYNFARPVLQEAFAYARRNNAKIMAEAVNRYLRPGDYWLDRDAEYMYEDLERIARMAKGLQLLTYFPPNMPEREVHGHQIQRGKMKPARRGSKRTSNEVRRETVEALHAQGYSNGEIMRQTGVPSSNVSRWILESVVC